MRALWSISIRNDQVWIIHFGPEMTEDEIVEIAGTWKDPRSPPPSMPSEDEHSSYNVLDSDNRAAVCDDTPFMVLDSDDSTVDE